MDYLKYMKNKFKNFHDVSNDWDIILQITLINGKEDIAIYAINQGCRVSSVNIETASLVCSLELVRCIIEENPEIEITSTCLNYAILSGNLEILKYLYEKGCKPNQATLLYINDCKNEECAHFAYYICRT